MWSDGHERAAVLPWCQSSEPCRFAVGDTVIAEPYADVTGIVAAVDIGARTISIIWSDGNGGAIVYPLEASFLVKVEKMPWQ